MRQEVGYTKPDLTIFEFLINEYSILASQILYVVNSQKDDLSGVYTAGLQVAWVNRTNDNLSPETPRPHYEISNLSELLEILL